MGMVLFTGVISSVLSRYVSLLCIQSEYTTTMQSGNDSCSVSAIGKLADKTGNFAPGHLGASGNFHHHHNSSINRIVDEGAFLSGAVESNGSIEAPSNHLPEIPQHRGGQLHHNNLHPQHIQNAHSAWLDEFHNSHFSQPTTGLRFVQGRSEAPSHMEASLGDNNVISGNSLNFQNMGPSSLKFETYDYYNIATEVPVPRSPGIDTEALQRQFDELELELSQLDLEADVSSSLDDSTTEKEATLQSERELFRDTASEIYTFTAESTPYLAEATHSKLANSKFMGLMRTIGNGSINLHDNNKELCSTSTKEIFGNAYFHVPESQ